MSECSNFSNIESEWRTKSNEVLPQTSTLENFSNCYVCLEHRLITPDGYVYPCPSIAEVRDPSLALGHILDHDDVFARNLQYYYLSKSPWCCERFCRHATHNNIVDRYLNSRIAPHVDAAIRNDPFF